MNGKMLLYHTGFLEIKEPDIHYGRKNADFGQGFYLSDKEEFSRRWATEKKDHDTYINYYELDLNDLKIKTFERNAAWFDYIYHNRKGYPDVYAEYDLIIGPIANDTIFNTFGFTTSGFLTQEESLKLLDIGPEYTQIVIKTEKAVNNLAFLHSVVLTHEEIVSQRKELKKEEEAYQKLFAGEMQKLV